MDQKRSIKMAFYRPEEVLNGPRKAFLDLIRSHKNLNKPLRDLKRSRMGLKRPIMDLKRSLIWT